MMAKKKALKRKEVEKLFEEVINDMKQLCGKGSAKGSFMVGVQKIGTIRYLLSVRLDAILGADDE